MLLWAAPGPASPVWKSNLWQIPLLTVDEVAVLQQALTGAVLHRSGKFVPVSIAAADMPIASPSLQQNCTAAAGPGQYCRYTAAIRHAVCQLRRRVLLTSELETALLQHQIKQSARGPGMQECGECWLKQAALQELVHQHPLGAINWLVRCTVNVAFCTLQTSGLQGRWLSQPDVRPPAAAITGSHRTAAGKWGHCCRSFECGVLSIGIMAVPGCGSLPTSGNDSSIRFSAAASGPHKGNASILPAPSSATKLCD